MKNLYIFALLLLLCAFHANGQYITVWKTDNPGTSESYQILIPATGTNYNIVWEEVGVPANHGTATGSGAYTLTFPSAGTYQVSITPGSGTFTRIHFNSLNDFQKLLEIKQWGDIQWESMEGAYERCSNMTITATDIPNLQNVTSMAEMFGNCGSLPNIPGINSWDVSTVTNMQGMFAYTDWNEPIGNWNVGSVTNMSAMFSNASFNQPIGSWNVSNVTDMSAMFADNPYFNQPIGSWNVSNVTSMRWMFIRAASFNQSLENWDVSQVTDMYGMFEGATTFNGVLNGWNAGNVLDMSRMFRGTTNFNQPIGSWNVSKVSLMNSMFSGAVSFNQPLNSWNVGQVTSMSRMFEGASTFNGTVSSWNVGNVTDMSFMFSGAVAFNQPVNNWNLTQATNLLAMFLQALSFNQPVNNWNVSHVTNLSGVFAYASSFNQSLSKWTISAGANMTSILSLAAVDCVNMTLTLQGWAANTATPNNITFGAEVVNYGPPAVAALETLRTTKNWTIAIGEQVICEALEVSLISFSAKNADGSVKLEWSTASETDNDYFEIERSADAHSWNTIKRIEGAGTVSSVRNYSFVDSSPLEGTSYYRLKIVDFKGKADYSNVRAVSINDFSTRSIYPNPATNAMTFSGKAEGHLWIYNLSGRQVMQIQLKAEKTSIPLSGLPSGAYLIKSDDGWNSKFVKD